MSYYVRMKIDNYIIERYGFKAWIHATIQDNKEVFYAMLYKGEYDECEVRVENNFATFTEAHDFLVEAVKDRLVPYIDNVRIKGKWAAEDLEEVNNQFNL